MTTPAQMARCLDTVCSRLDDLILGPRPSAVTPAQWSALAADYGNLCKAYWAMSALALQQFNATVEPLCAQLQAETNALNATLADFKDAAAAVALATSIVTLAGQIVAAAV